MMRPRVSSASRKIGAEATLDGVYVGAPLSPKRERMSWNVLRPPIEDMGIRMLLNECDPLERGGEYIYLAVASTVSGMARPRALAVLRLMTRS